MAKRKKVSKAPWFLGTVVGVTIGYFAVWKKK